MTTITNLTGTVGLPVPKPKPQFNNPPAPKEHPTMHNVQSRKGFWRTMQHYKDRLEFISSTGGAVSIPIAALWTTAEAADEKLKIPVVAPSVPTPETPPAT